MRKSLWFLICLAALAVPGFAANLPDYGQPPLLTGRIYEPGSGTNKLLFTFRRTAVLSNDTVLVTRDFLNPDGSLAAREETAYRAGELVGFSLDERQTGASGSAIRTEPAPGKKLQLRFAWAAEAGAGQKTDEEGLQPDTLVGDMISYFLATHWEPLARGEAVNFRFVVPSRLETVGFKFVKDGELASGGIPALRIRMEASNFIIARIVDPLFFVVEKSAPHRVLEYTGRITPKQRDGRKWKDQDARTVYDWP